MRNSLHFQARNCSPVPRLLRRKIGYYEKYSYHDSCRALMPSIGKLLVTEKHQFPLPMHGITAVSLLVIVWLLHGVPDAGRNGGTVMIRLHGNLLQVHLGRGDVLMAQRFLHCMQAP